MKQKCELLLYFPTHLKNLRIEGVQFVVVGFNSASCKRYCQQQNTREF